MCSVGCPENVGTEQGWSQGQGQKSLFKKLAQLWAQEHRKISSLQRRNAWKDR